MLATILSLLYYSIIFGSWILLIVFIYFLPYIIYWKKSVWFFISNCFNFLWVMYLLNLVLALWTLIHRKEPEEKEEKVVRCKKCWRILK